MISDTPDQHFTQAFSMLARSVDFGPNRPKVHLLASALGSPEFERLLIRSLGEMLAQTDCPLVCIEAAEGPASWMGRTRTADNVAALDALLDQGDINAAIYLQACGDFDFELWGVDDLSLYRQSAAIVNGRHESLRWWAGLIGALDELVEGSLIHEILRAAELTPRLRQLAGGSAASHASALLDAAHELGIALPPELEALDGAAREQERIDFPRANREAQHVMARVLHFFQSPDAWLGRELEDAAAALEIDTPAEAQRLGDRSAGYADRMRQTLVSRIVAWYTQEIEGAEAPRTGDALRSTYRRAAAHLAQNFERRRQRAPSSTVSDNHQLSDYSSTRELYGYIVDLLPLFDIPVSEVEHLVASERTARLFRPAHFAELFAPLEALHGEVIARLATPRQRECVALARRLALAGDFLSFRSTRADIVTVHKDRLLSDHGRLCHHIRDLTGDVAALREFEQARVPYEQAYREGGDWIRIHRRRAETMAKRTIEKMAERHLREGVLIAGGFHEREIVSRLGAQEVSCNVTHPEVTREAGPGEWDSYLQRLDRQ